MTLLPPRRRLETDREDLMREATALRRRVEFHLSLDGTTVIAGYRSDVSLSIYFGFDPCYHFDPGLCLRRAYVQGDLYRTQGSTLARLQRHRTDDAVVLQRHDLSAEECERFLDRTKERLQSFAESLTTGTAVCVQCVPVGTDITSQLKSDLLQIVTHQLILAPTIRGKR